MTVARARLVPNRGRRISPAFPGSSAATAEPAWPRPPRSESWAAAAPRSYAHARMSSSRSGERTLLVGTFVAFAVLYLATASRWLLGGDAGEFAAIGASGGVPHPPGYPLYVLWLRALAWLPAASPAHRASLATALLGAGTVTTLLWASLRHGVRREVAFPLAALFALAPLPWMLATGPEVFTLNALLAMAIVGLAAPPFEEGLPRRAFLLGLLAGLGLANHHTIVLLAPVGLAAAITVVRRSPAPAKTAGLAVLGLALGLLPYAYLAVVARGVTVADACAWGSPGDLGSLVRHFLRADYGTTKLAISNAPPEPAGQLALLARNVAGGLAAVPIVAAVVVLLALVRPGKTGFARGTVVALLTSFLLAGPVFVSRFNLPPRGLQVHVLERFHVLPMALAIVLTAIAIEATMRLVVADEAERERRSRILGGVLLAAALVRGGLAWDRVSESHRPTTEHYLRNVLSVAGPNAIVVGSGDDVTGAALYQRCALHTRPDVEIVSPHLLLGAWYPEQVSARLGFPVVRGVKGPGDENPKLSLPDLLAQLVETGRPVYVTDWYVPGVEKKIPSYPVGPLIRIVRSAQEIPPPDALLAENLKTLKSLELEATPPAKDSWGGVRMKAYARPFLVLAAAYEAEGKPQRAELCRKTASAFLPEP